MTIIAIWIIASLTFFHFEVNRGGYSKRNKTTLPILYAGSIGALFATELYSLWYIAPFVLITLIKCKWLTGHVPQITLDVFSEKFRESPRTYISTYDGLALIFVLITKGFSD